MDKPYMLVSELETGLLKVLLVIYKHEIHGDVVGSGATGFVFRHCDLPEEEI